MPRPRLLLLNLYCKFIIQCLRTRERSVLQHGEDYIHKDCDALVPLGHCVPFVASRQTTTEEPGCSARFVTVCHSNEKTGNVGEIGASEWRRSL